MWSTTKSVKKEKMIFNNSGDVDIIKLDIEGRWFEMLTEILDLALPVKCILVECEMYINDTDYEFGRLDSIVERYKTAGFKVYTNRVTSGKCVELCFLKN